MGTRTYYEILGVSRDATLEEITSAKNALAKVYHPDANMQNDIDTTAYMQEILEAYRILSNPDKRKKYNQKLFGKQQRVFRTYTMTDAKEEDTDFPSFVTYWNAACKLNETIEKSIHLMEYKAKKKSLPQKIFRKIGKDTKKDTFRLQQLNQLSLQAIQYIATLKSAEIPMDYWNPDAMNWVLVRWGQKQNMDYLALFSRYDAFVEQNKSSTEKLRLKSHNRQFHHNLKKLLSYALEA
ncbi:MAG: DnaJ domain-containing protein [Clostridiales bacterium]|nr:DnaJ domain-containing protein [Clostridiales bacterium]